MRKRHAKDILVITNQTRVHVCTSSDTEACIVSMQTSSQKTLMLFKFCLCHCQNKNTGLRQPQSQPCLSSNGLQKEGPHKPYAIR